MFLISILAAILSTTASIPQILGSTSRLSNVTMTLRGIGAILWVIYGTSEQQYALAISSAIAAMVECLLFTRTNYYRVTESDDTEHCPTVAVNDSSQSIELSEH